MRDLSDFYTTMRDSENRVNSKVKDNLRKFIEDTMRRDLESLRGRVDDLESSKGELLPIPLLKPSDGLEEVKTALNHIMTYLNIGVRNG